MSSFDSARAELRTVLLAFLGSSPRRIVAALATFAILLTLACGQPPADPSTPAGTLRLYLEDLKRGGVQDAFTRLSSKLQGECRLETLTPRVSEFREQLENASVIVRRTELTGDANAVIEASINSGDADIGIGGRRSGGGFDFTYRMTKEGGEWRFSEYGWPINWCEGARPEKPVPPPPTPQPVTPSGQ